MKIRLSGGGTSSKDGRPPASLMIGCLVVAGCTAFGGLWFIFGREDVQAAPAAASEGEKLRQRGASKAAETNAGAAKLKQDPIGEGYDFDADGRLLGAHSDDADLPANRTLAQLTAEEDDTTSAIRAEMRRPARLAPASPRLDGYAQPAKRAAEPADRGLLTQSMLAYSTVASGGGADRRPQAAGGTGARESAGADKQTSEGNTDERLMGMMERLQEGVLQGVEPGAEGKAAAPALYPAQQSAQTFGKGAIGDMRISAGPGVVVRQGKFLDCALVNQLRVDLAESPVIAMVTRNFLTADGNQVLIPAGAKLLGSAGTVQNPQQARVYIKFDRVIYPDQRAAYFPVRQVGAVDGAGAVGIAGDVDRHLVLQFGAAIVLGVLDGLGAAVQSANAAREPTARDLVLGQTSSNFGQILGGILQRYANVVPTITVPPGTSLKVFFAEDVRVSPYMRSSDLSWMR